MSDDPHADPFAPPELSTEVCCLHCGETYDSWQIEWRVSANAEGGEHGFWCCPIPDCDGKGFGFDILPTDPNYQDERGGWVFDGDDDGEDEEGDDAGDFDDWNDGEFPLDVELGTDDLLDDILRDAPPAPKPPDQREDWPFSMN